MCGICGIFHYRGDADISPERLACMNLTLRHRGPDEDGVLIRPGVGIAMQRLSIVDLAGGRQPIGNEDGTAWIVFNGEIYNHAELRAELIRAGHHFRTRSDTEVILHLYEQHGAACVDRLDGMFAFAIYDGRPQPGGASPPAPAAGRLLLARDRLGKKPLYYADVGGALLFASELKALLRDPRVSKELDAEAVHHYLSLLVVPAPLSIFRCVRKLPPGHTLTCDAAGVRIARYWSYLDHLGDEAVDENHAVDRVRELLFAAVRKRLAEEVPYGAFLSGGLDSSAIVAVMSRIADAPVRTFSIGFEGAPRHDELPAARALAVHCGTDHREFRLRPDVIELVQQVAQYADEPFAISSAIPTLLMSRAASGHVKVVLTGDGGDEVFGGYPTYLYERWAAVFRRMPTLAASLVERAVALLGGHLDERRGRLRVRVTRFARNAHRPAGARRLGWASGFDELEKRNLLAPEMRAVLTAASTERWLDEVVGADRVCDPLARLNAMDVLVWLADEMLTKVDRMTMAASLEARSPLLDRALVEFVAGISFRVKVPGARGSSLKHLLRRAVADLLPPALLDRPKQGFNVPLDAWFRGEAGAFMRSVLDSTRIRTRGVFDPAAVRELVDAHTAGRINASNRLYALLMFEVWAERYL